ncbi:MAG TPA: hypothetical protein P5287_05875 [bacterium]|nr:hypothetical protein [bacterium]
MTGSPAVILPDLQFSVLCDNVTKDDHGKMSFAGLFETISAASYPCTHGTLFVVNRWVNGYGAFRQQTRLVAPDNDSVLAQDDETSFTLRGSDTKHTIVARFNNILFQSQGKYWIEIRLNGEPVLRYPLYLEKKS